jgi:hypothetical protein
MPSHDRDASRRIAKDQLNSLFLLVGAAFRLCAMLNGASRR